MSDQTSQGDANEVSAEFGYTPELKRTLGSFQVFAVSFAFISVAVGIFGTYGMLLNNSGPVGIWTWLIALAGQLLVALVIAQFAAPHPAQRFVVPVGVPTGQSSRGLDLRVADVLLPGHRTHGDRLRHGQPVFDAAVQHVARRAAPIPATVLPLVIGIVVMFVMPGDALIQLITAGTLFPAITYGLVVTLYLVVRNRLDRRTWAFDLGRFELPVSVTALVWTVCAVVILVSPIDATVPVIIVVGLILLGSVYFTFMLVFRREVLDTEPGHDVFGGTDERPRDPAAEEAGL